MNAPLWRIMLGILLLAFAAQRGAVGVVLVLDEQSPWLALAYAAQFVMGVLLWIALLWVPRRIVSGLLALGATIVAGAMIGGLTGAMTPAAVASQIAVAAAGTAIFAYVARHAIEDDA